LPASHMGNALLRCWHPCSVTTCQERARTITASPRRGRRRGAPALIASMRHIAGRLTIMASRWPIRIAACVRVIATETAGDRKAEPSQSDQLSVGSCVQLCDVHAITPRGGSCRWTCWRRRPFSGARAVLIGHRPSPGTPATRRTPHAGYGRAGRTSPRAARLAGGGSGRA
jgi:hypothetical protein